MMTAADPRATYWLSPYDISLVRSALDEDASSVADAIRDEISVASTRSKSHALDPKKLTIALGLDPASRPYMFSDAERLYILSKDIPAVLIERLQ